MGRTLIVWAKIAGVLALLGAGALYVLLFHSATDSYFDCDGSFHSRGAQGEIVTPDRAFLKLTEYRPWVRASGDSQGIVTAQFDQRALSYLSLRVQRIGDGPLRSFQFLDFDGAAFTGGLRMANLEVSISPTAGVTFTGRCTPRPPQ